MVIKRMGKTTKVRSKYLILKGTLLKIIFSVKITMKSTSCSRMSMKNNSDRLAKERNKTITYKFVTTKTAKKI